MILKRIQVKTTQPNLLTNAYIVCDEESKETLVVDPGGEAERLAEMIDVLGGELKYIFVTHCHADHIGGIAKLKELKGGKILISRDDAEGLYNQEINLAYYINMDLPELEADSRVDDNDLIHLGNNEFKVLLTPGHTKGGLCLYSEKNGFVFKGTLTGLTNAAGAAAGAYILQGNNVWGRVTTTKTNAYIPPFRAYIVPKDSEASMLLSGNIGDDDVTGVQNIRTVDQDGTEHWYDLNGRSISKPIRKGLYIVNGRKD